MKSFARLLVICLIIFALIADYAGLEAAKIFNRNGNGNGNGLIYCKWSTRKTCSKTSKFCVKLTVGTAPNAVITCKQYKNECAFMMDNCLQQTGKCEPLPHDYPIYL